MAGAAAGIADVAPSTKDFLYQFSGGLLLSHAFSGGWVEPVVAGYSAKVPIPGWNMPSFPGSDVIVPLLSPWFAVGGIASGAAGGLGFAAGTAVGVGARAGSSPWRWAFAGLFAGLALGYILEE